LTQTIIEKRKRRKKEEVRPSAHPIKATDGTIDKLTGVFKLLADKSRLKIVMALAEHGTMHVTDLCNMLDQTQPAVSHHLTLMRIVGLVGYDRDGKHNYYYLASDYLRRLFEMYFRDAGDDDTTLHFDDFSLTFVPAAGS